MGRNDRGEGGGTRQNKEKLIGRKSHLMKDTLATFINPGLRPSFPGSISATELCIDRERKSRSSGIERGRFKDRITFEHELF